jgi:hypothetical protein
MRSKVKVVVSEGRGSYGESYKKVNRTWTMQVKVYGQSTKYCPIYTVERKKSKMDSEKTEGH